MAVVQQNQHREASAPISPVRCGAYGLTIDNPRGLLLCRNGSAHYLPGGGIEPGESAEQALVREFHEETGHIVRVIAPLGVRSQLIWGGTQRLLAAYYAVNLGEKLRQETEHSTCWCSIDDALNRLHRVGDKAILAYLFD